MTKYRLFLDESGNHGLTEINEDFPIFLLCGVIIGEDRYEALRQSINDLKNRFWSNINVILHSRDIRKCDKEFSILFDLEIKQEFYEKINQIVVNNDYKIIATVIRKDKFIERYGRLSNDVYEICLSFIIERAIFFLDDIKGLKELEIVIEKRGKKEDKQLDEHFQRLLARGTHYVSRERLAAYNTSIVFKAKKENINGLQLADLVAYPIAQHVIAPDRPNPAFDVLKDKFYSKNNRRYGLKEFP
ncbi:DUF3800 domain-containing protein [uncultured Chitinophaga sp.]|jgi:hypothetical protein|uniref:DUF3800 domain-containing protein n=1 Tax=uncultured Chitinophaga sp. TaxID=339340 RepID=UPI00262E8991|nr:DUF3800 domain-containing protein [uncultured Chitinophaga sp.]